MSFLSTVNQQMIDAAEAAGVVIGVSNNSVPVGHCMIFAKGTMVYHGLLADLASTAPGTVAVLNPADFDRFDAHMKKRRH